MNTEERDMSANSNAAEGPKKGFSRRSFLARTGAAASVGVVLSGVTRASSTTGSRTGILINQRGGADGLSIVCPTADPTYTSLRPTIAVATPAPGSRAILDGTFAMSPGGVDSSGGTLDWLEPYKDGHLCFVHGCGMMNQGRSHFTAMLNMEHGVNPGSPFPADGWAGRYIGLAPDSGNPVRGFSHGNLLPTALRGAPKTSAIADVSNLSFPGPDTPPPPPQIETNSFRQHVVSKMYDGTLRIAAKDSAEQAFAALAELSSVSYPAPGTNGYPDTPFGRSMAYTAAIIKDPNVHVEFVHFDLGSWDHHQNQEPNMAGGVMFDILNDLSTSLGAFYADLGGPAGVGQYLVMMYTEFGRQIAENGTFGTDHGYGSVAMAMGSGLAAGAGGSVFSELGPLATEFDPIVGDALNMTIDFRDVWKEALENQLCLDPLDYPTVFPGFTPRVTTPGIIA